MEVADWPPPQAPYTLLGLLLWGQTGTHVPFRSPGRGFAPGIDASLFLSIYIERGIVVLQWLVLLVVTGFLLRRLLTTLRLWNATKNIPGPPWGSFFGDTRGCPSGEDFNGYLSKMHELYGSTVKVWLTPTELLVSFKDPLVIRDILFKVKDKFPLFGRALRLAFGRCNLFSPLYEEVKPRRAILELNLNKFLLTKSKTISFEMYAEIKEFQNGASGSNSFYAPNMQLLMATVYESIQLLPAGPLLQRCSTKQNTQQEETKSKHDKHLHIMGERNKTAAIFPFGLGPRACVGQKFVIQAVSTLLASLLLHYQVKTQPGLPNHIKRDASGLKEETPKNRNIALLKRK